MTWLMRLLSPLSAFLLGMMTLDSLPNHGHTSYEAWFIAPVVFLCSTLYVWFDRGDPHA